MHLLLGHVGRKKEFSSKEKKEEDEEEEEEEEDFVKHSSALEDLCARRAQQVHTHDHNTPTQKTWTVAQPVLLR